MTRRKSINLRKRAAIKFWSRYNGEMECSYCKNPICRYMADGDPLKATVDHIIPLSYNMVNSNDMSNLALCCYKCNQERSGHKLPREVSNV